MEVDCEETSQPRELNATEDQFVKLNPQQAIIELMEPPPVGFYCFRGQLITPMEIDEPVTVAEEETYPQPMDWQSIPWWHYSW